MATYLPLPRFHHLSLESMPRGVRVERRIILENGRRRAFRADEKVRRIRVVESAARASSSRDVETAGVTIYSVVAYEDTT